MPRSGPSPYTRGCLGDSRVCELRQRGIQIQEPLLFASLTLGPGLSASLSTSMHHNGKAADSWMGNRQIEQVDSTVTDQEQVDECRSSEALRPLLTPCLPISSGNVPVSLQVIHKAVLDVGEEGTEGAAVTAVVMATSSLLHTLTVSFNRPFLLSIFCKETQSIIFLGKVTNPKEA